MKQLIESFTVTEFIFSLLIIVGIGILVIYWDAKRLRDKEKQKKKEVDRLLEYEADDREVEYYRKQINTSRECSERTSTNTERQKPG